MKSWVRCAFFVCEGAGTRLRFVQALARGVKALHTGVKALHTACALPPPPPPQKRTSRCCLSCKARWAASARWALHEREAKGHAVSLLARAR